MAQKPTRDIIRIVIDNFWKSLKKANAPKGKLMGEDYFGNKYFEIAANPAEGKRKASRWFEPAVKDAFDTELTAEWDGWLRGRRDNPPTREELMKNLQLMEMKKHNAAKLEQQYHGDKPKEQDTYGTYPKYEEYEIIPGKKPPKP